MMSRIFGSMKFTPMSDIQLRRWESRRRVGPFFYAIIWGLGVNGLVVFCLVTTYMSVIRHMKFDETMLAAGSSGFVVGLMSRWGEWHSEESRFCITKTMKREENSNSIARSEG
jgi:hypothetical protein